MIRTAISSAALLILVGLIHAADKPNDGPAAIEQKLLGEWVGGPCMGELIFRADKTFERRNYSPGGSTLKGVWELQWKALPPALVLNCNNSDNPSFIGSIEELNLVQLNDEAFAYQHPGDESLTLRYKRMGQVKARVIYGSEPRDEQVADLEPWISKEIEKAGSSLALPLSGWTSLSAEEKRLYTSPQGGFIIDGKATETDGQYEIEINGCNGGPLRASATMKPGERRVVNLTNDSAPTKVFIALEVTAKK